MTDIVVLITSQVSHTLNGHSPGYIVDEPDSLGEILLRCYPCTSVLGDHDSKW